MTPDAPKASFADTLAVYLKARVLIVLFLGFSAGLPLALSGSTLRVWLRESGIDLQTIGLFALVGTPYTIKFLWAPVVDALHVPLLSRWLGRRRGWLVFSQLLLMAAIVLLAFCDPAHAPWYVVFGAALLVATASATQDIVIDAFRIESLDESEQAAGMASYVAAYRIGTLVSTAGVLYLADGLERFGFGKGAAFGWCYLAMAVLVVAGMLTALVAGEPNQSQLAEAVAGADDNPLLRVARRAVTAFLDFFSYDMAIIALVFVVLFKFTDAYSGIMTEAFVLDLGFAKTDLANIVKGVGLAATLLGGFAGGFVARAYPLATSLWIGGLLQAFANFGFSGQALIGHNIATLTAAIVVENFTSAIGTVIFVAYLSALCRNPLHTATQYALLTALSAVGRTFLSASAGYVAAWSGWAWFFAICALVGLPGLMMLAWLQRSGHFAALDKTTR